MMTRVLPFFIACSLFVSGGASLGNAATPIEFPSDSTGTLFREFAALAEQWRTAYNAADSVALTSMYAEDADYISGHVSGLVAHGRNRLIANFLNGIRLGGHVDSIAIISIEQSCDLATLLCTYEATNAGQKAVGRNLLVVKRVNNRWLIVTHMTVV